jgi:Xaa-Pro aminopeptidase
MSHISNIQQWLDALDALLLTDPISIRYASGFYITDGAALIARNKAWLITDSRYIEAAQQAVSDMEVLSVSAKQPLYTLLRELIEENNIRTVGAEETRLTHSAWLSLEQRLERPLTPAGHILARLRTCKDAQEITYMIAAQRIAEKALDEVLGIIRPGLTEKQVAAELVYRMYKYGGEANSFDPIVVTGKKTSMPHGVPGDEIIQEGDFVTMDFGTMYGGYCSDMTRTVAVGHATDEMKHVYETVLEAQLAGIAAARPAATGRSIDKAARDVITKAGFGQYFGHSFGHSLGLEIHESPNASPANNQSMPAGTVISAEPGIYIPGQFGVRIEDVLWLRSGGAEVITKAPKSLLIL